jgi:hypothetical protein
MRVACAKLRQQYVSRSVAMRLPEVPIGLATGWMTKGPSSSPGMVKIFHFSTLSRLALRSTQPAIQWVPELFPWE